jgi:hypothetical protein
VDLIPLTQGRIECTRSVWNQKRHFLEISASYGGRKKIITFWDTESCSLVEVYRRFRDVYCLHYQGDDGGNAHF